MEILKYKPVQKENSVLKGTFSLKLPKWGNVTISDMSYFAKNGNRWISFPAKQYESNGEKKFFSYLRFESREIQDAFNDSVLLALDDFFRKNKMYREDAPVEQLPF